MGITQPILRSMPLRWLNWAFRCCHFVLFRSLCLLCWKQLRWVPIPKPFPGLNERSQYHIRPTAEFAPHDLSRFFRQFACLAIWADGCGIGKRLTLAKWIWCFLRAFMMFNSSSFDMRSRSSVSLGRGFICMPVPSGCLDHQFLTRGGCLALKRFLRCVLFIQ